MSQPERKPIWLRDYANVQALTEKPIYEMVCGVYRSVGVEVVRHSQPFKAAQTKGIWDCECYWRSPLTHTPDDGMPIGTAWRDSEGQWWRVIHWGHEVKRYATRNQRRKSQTEFHSKMALYGVPSITGGLNTAIAFLEGRGIARLDLLPNHW